MKYNSAAIYAAAVVAFYGRFQEAKETRRIGILRGADSTGHFNSTAGYAAACAKVYQRKYGCYATEVKGMRNSSQNAANMAGAAYNRFGSAAAGSIGDETDPDNLFPNTKKLALPTLYSCVGGYTATSAAFSSGASDGTEGYLLRHIAGGVITNYSQGSGQDLPDYGAATGLTMYQGQDVGNGGPGSATTAGSNPGVPTSATAGVGGNMNCVINTREPVRLRLGVAGISFVCRPNIAAMEGGGGRTVIFAGGSAVTVDSGDAITELTVDTTKWLRWDANIVGIVGRIVRHGFACTGAGLLLDAFFESLAPGSYDGGIHFNTFCVQGGQGLQYFLQNICDKTRTERVAIERRMKRIIDVQVNSSGVAIEPMLIVQLGTGANDHATATAAYRWDQGTDTIVNTAAGGGSNPAANTQAGIECTLASIMDYLTARWVAAGGKAGNICFEDDYHAHLPSATQGAYLANRYLAATALFTAGYQILPMDVNNIITHEDGREWALWDTSGTSYNNRASDISAHPHNIESYINIFNANETSRQRACAARRRTLYGGGMRSMGIGV